MRWCLHSAFALCPLFAHSLPLSASLCSSCCPLASNSAPHSPGCARAVFMTCSCVHSCLPSTTPGFSVKSDAHNEPRSAHTSLLSACTSLHNQPPTHGSGQSSLSNVMGSFHSFFYPRTMPRAEQVLRDLCPMSASPHVLVLSAKVCPVFEPLVPAMLILRPISTPLGSSPFRTVSFLAPSSSLGIKDALFVAGNSMCRYSQSA